MSTTDLAYTTPPEAPRWKRWLLLSPLARIVIFIVLLAVIGVPTIFILGRAGLIGHAAHGLPAAVGDPLWRSVPALGAYLLLVRFIERRRVIELKLRNLPVQASVGIIFGVLLISAVMATLWLAGSYHVTGTSGHVAWLAAILSLGVGAAISEEIVFRGVLFRIVEEGLGTWGALVVSALAFGAVHLSNPNATLGSATAIAIEAGILFGLLYHVTRSLWLCMGLHAAWNVMEGPVYGTSVSGLPAHGWLQSTLTGPAWLSGGHFGPEDSLVTVAWCAALSLVLLIVALRRRSIVPPYWWRQRRNAEDTQTRA